MDNNKLFKKLNERMGVNSVKNSPITESEKKEIEKKLIFKESVKEVTNLVNFNKK